MRALRTTILFVCPLILALSLSACDGGGESEEEGGADGEGDATAWIAGTWSGNVRGKDDTQDGANLVETTVEATFKSDQAKTGEFTFIMPQLEKVEVKGTFADFAGKSLLLTIKESNFSTLGMPGNTTDLDYALIGDALELSNARIVLKLIRKDDAGGDGGGDGSDGETPTGGFIDDWTCGDKAGRTWKVNLGSDGSFAIKVYDVPSPVLTMSGNYTLTADGIAVLVVADSNLANYEGQQLTGRLEGEGTMLFSRMTRTGNDTSIAAETFNCGRE